MMHYRHVEFFFLLLLQKDKNALNDKNRSSWPNISVAGRFPRQLFPMV